MALMEDEDFDHTIKVVFTGASGVGKSSMMLRFTEGVFNPQQAVTVGLDFKIHLLDANGHLKIRLNIWDTAGQEKFHSLTGSYYRGAQGIFIVYNVADRQSFESLSKTLEEVDLYTTKKNVVKILVGNKIDLEERQVSFEEGRQFAKDHGILFQECSCKDDLHVNDAFETLVNSVLDRPSLLESKKTAGTVGLKGAETDAAGCCW
eukprot:TRINITY_DN13339_c0_g1_i1.p1 TRINITY_DN13339_c0_g1~~TRINITY_DN13339_c0_g1_i1.p1  ORF type:complete len:205 (+),score=49.46 TRINITY_DN13339_c0_g1_i1:87-701(+)